MAQSISTSLRRSIVCVNITVTLKSEIGVTGNYLDWIKSYLINRRQYVTVSGMYHRVYILALFYFYCLWCSLLKILIFFLYQDLSHKTRLLLVGMQNLERGRRDAMLLFLYKTVICKKLNTRPDNAYLTVTIIILWKISSYIYYGQRTYQMYKKHLWLGIL